MIVIIGYPRTGTSILFKSLEAAGFNGGSHLWGHKYKTQDFYLNKLVTYIDEDLKEYNGVSLALAREIQSFFSVYCEVEGINMIKSPNMWEALHIWNDFCPEFKKAKFLWTRRNALETAKSAKRTHHKFGWKDTKTVRWHVKRIGEQVNIVSHFLADLDHKTVRLEDMISLPVKTFREISEFVGREVKSDLITHKSTYMVNGEVN
jgi:hypothetical protein